MQQRTIERRRQIRELHEQGMTAIDIAAELGVAKDTVWADLRAMELTPHSPKPPEEEPDCFNCPFPDCRWEQHGLCPAQMGDTSKGTMRTKAQARREKVKEYCEMGLTVYDMAIEFCCSPDAIRADLKILGLAPVRQRRRWRKKP